MDETKKVLIILSIIIITALSYIGYNYSHFKNQDMIQQPEEFKEELQCIEWNVNGNPVNRYYAEMLCQLSDECNWVKITKDTLIMNLTYEKRALIKGEIIANITLNDVFEYNDCIKKDYVFVK